MDADYTILLIALVIFFIAGMAIFLVWKLFEPKLEGETRTLMDFVIKPAAAMAAGVSCLGIYIIFPRASLWVFGGIVLIGVVALVRMPTSRKEAIVRAIAEPDPADKLLFTRLILAVVVVFATLAGLLAIFVA